MADKLDEYVVYRKGMGYAPRGIKPPLLAFDRYLKEQKADWDQLQPAFFLNLRANIREHPNTVNKILYGIRCLFQFLVRQGLYDVNPLADIPMLPERYFVPFVFTPAQTEQLLCAVCKRMRRSERWLLFDMANYLAIVMLARCGMRINEPLQLYRDHFRSNEGTVYIEKTKFRKDRLIPVPKSVQQAIENYLSVRDALCVDDLNPYLLAGIKNTPILAQRIRKVFYRAVKDIGLDQTKKIMGNITFGAPVPHSLRHSFIINILNRIKKRGISPQQALPVLAAYVGHRKYQYTGAYLKIKDAKDLPGLIDFTKSKLDVL